MPTYNYKCSNKSCCLIQKETHKMTDKNLTKCPLCGEETYAKTFEKLPGEEKPQVGSFQLKGTGWFKTGGY